MGKEIERIIRHLENTVSGQPWFGRSVLDILKEVDPAKASIKPNNREHSLVELLYHMNTWAGFTLANLEENPAMDAKSYEKLDWRDIDPASHSWEKAMAEFKSLHEKIIKELGNKDDSLLEQTVENRKFNFRFMLNGLIQHHIYHLGQIAYVKKMLD